MTVFPKETMWTCGPEGINYLLHGPADADLLLLQAAAALVAAAESQRRPSPGLNDQIQTHDIMYDGTSHQLFAPMKFPNLQYYT